MTLLSSQYFQNSHKNSQKLNNINHKKTLQHYLQESLLDDEDVLYKEVYDNTIIDEVFNDILNSNSYKEYDENVLHLKTVLDDLDDTNCKYYANAYTSNPRFKKDKSYIIIGNLDQSNPGKGVSHLLIDGTKSDTLYAWVLIGSKEWNHRFPISISAFSSDGEDAPYTNQIHALHLGGPAYNLKREIQRKGFKYDDMGVYVYELSDGDQIYERVKTLIRGNNLGGYTKKIKK